MTVEEFNKILEKQIEICKDILIKKAEEYATQDRLHNFKIAAKVQGCSNIQALAGMMAKHTINSNKIDPEIMYEEYKVGRIRLGISYEDKHVAIEQTDAGISFAEALEIAGLIIKKLIKLPKEEK